jgi:hypothetical protein
VRDEAELGELRLPPRPAIDREQQRKRDETAAPDQHSGEMEELDEGDHAANPRRQPRRSISQATTTKGTKPGTHITRPASC